jgi:hypothetical protein
VFLEGLEVAFIVLTFGANSGQVGLSAAGAVVAFVAFALLGLVVHKPLSRVPENSIKFTVGLMLISFGTFWAGEGIGIDWKLSDGTILVALAVYCLVKGFAYFWYDFIVGDSIVLALGGVGALVASYVVVALGAAALAEIILPIVVIATIVSSLIL